MRMTRFYLTFLRKTFFFVVQMVQEVTEFEFFQDKNPKISLISPKYRFGDIRETFWVFILKNSNL